LEDGVAFELYWAEFNHDDIVRRTIGSACWHIEKIKLIYSYIIDKGEEYELYDWKI
jgi:hypothetical protein